jgi:AraC-like DNA-binding protein/quercetin dioxygenase-like cupin family protein
MHQSENPNTDFVQFTAGAHLRDGVEVMHASFRKHRFAPHLHDTWSLGAVLSGAQDNSICGAPNVISTGELVLIPPFRPHAGHAVGDEPCRYVMLYVSEAELRTRAAALGIEAIEFPSHGVTDPWLAGLMSAFVIAAIESERSGGGADPMLDRALLHLLDQLLIRHAAPRTGNETSIHTDHVDAKRFEQRLDAALQHLKEKWNETVSLDELARRAALSPAHFCRRFSQTYGLPPHRYQLVLRIAQAKTMLHEGAEIGRIAMLSGFSDQSHFGRQFKSCFGFSPGYLTRKSEFR